MIPRDVDALVKLLDNSEPSEHFLLRYRLRSPDHGPGAGGEGVRTLNLIWCYLHALERLYATLTAPPFSWKKVPSVKIPVYVCDLAGLHIPPFALDGEGIFLPCRNEEPSLLTARHRAATEATHEATHIFCYAARTYSNRIRRHSWRWFHEATAVFMEGHILVDCPEAIRFMMSWADHPERSLDRPDNWYQTGMFARYLAKRLGPGVISALWNESLPEEAPFDTLDRLLQTTHQTPSLANHRDLFAQYAVDAYFTNDPSSHGFHPEVAARFRERAFAYSWRLGAGERAAQSFTLDHLACHYLRIRPRCGASALEIQVDAPAGFAAYAAIVGHDGHWVSPPSPAAPSIQLPLSGTDIDHVVVTVVNTNAAGSEDFKVTINAI